MDVATIDELKPDFDIRCFQVPAELINNDLYPLESEFFSDKIFIEVACYDHQVWLSMYDIAILTDLPSQKPARLAVRYFDDGLLEDLENIPPYKLKRCLRPIREGVSSYCYKYFITFEGLCQLCDELHNIHLAQFCRWVKSDILPDLLCESESDSCLITQFPEQDSLEGCLEALLKLPPDQLVDSIIATEVFKNHTESKVLSFQYRDRSYLIHVYVKNGTEMWILLSDLLQLIRTNRVSQVILDVTMAQKIIPPDWQMRGFDGELYVKEPAVVLLFGSALLKPDTVKMYHQLVQDLIEPFYKSLLLDKKDSLCVEGSYSNSVAKVDLTGCISMKAFAGLCCQKGITTGRNRLLEWFRRNHFLCTQQSIKNYPSQVALSLGLFRVAVVEVGNQSKYSPVLTPKGQAFFLAYFQKHQMHIVE